MWKNKVALVLLLTTGCFNNLLSQNVMSKYKKLKENEFKEYSTHNNCVLVANPYFKHCDFYECDKNTLIVVNKLENTRTLFLDRVQYYKKLNEIKRRQSQSFLFHRQKEILDFEANKKSLLDSLFEKLNLERPERISSVSLQNLDAKIKEYGVSKAFQQFYLNFIVFVGEYIVETKGGEWRVVENKSYPGEWEPVLVDKEGWDYHFRINVQLLKTYLEKASVKIEEIIQFALLPKLNVSTNQSGLSGGQKL